MMKRGQVIAAAMLLLSGCGSKETPVEEMIYIKSVSLYDTIYDMYQEPEQYLHQQYHMVGTLYPSQEDDGSKFYSIYAKAADGTGGLGIELDWSDYAGFSDYDKVTVEGVLEKEQTMHDGSEIEYLVLRVSKLEKRES